MHPNISEYVQIKNEIYTEALDAEERELLVDAIVENQLDIHSNEELYNVIEDNMFELIGYDYMHGGYYFDKLRNGKYIYEADIYEINNEEYVLLIYDIMVGGDLDDLYDNRRQYFVEELDGYNDEAMSKFNIYFTLRLGGHGYMCFSDY